MSSLARIYTRCEVVKMLNKELILVNVLRPVYKLVTLWIWNGGFIHGGAVPLTLCSRYKGGDFWGDFPDFVRIQHHLKPKILKNYIFIKTLTWMYSGLSPGLVDRGWREAPSEVNATLEPFLNRCPLNCPMFHTTVPVLPIAELPCLRSVDCQIGSFEQGRPRYQVWRSPFLNPPRQWEGGHV